MLVAGFGGLIVRRVVLLVCLFVLAAPVHALGAVNVTRSAAGGDVTITGTADADSIAIARAESGNGLLVDGRAGTAVTSSDGSCTPEPDAPATIRCEVPGITRVSVRLGAGADVLDAMLASRIHLTVRGGPGIDRLRVGAGGTVRVEDGSAQDVIDMSHADSPVRVRYDAKVRRVVAICSCPDGRARVELPISPGRVLLGSADDDVDLRAWRRAGVTTWELRDGRDQFLGSPRRRSIVRGGEDADKLVSFAARDTLRGGPGTDKLVDIGGRGDVLDGGPDMDALFSIDRQYDTLIGGAGLDVCYSQSRWMSGCGAGPKRSVEFTQYMPIITMRQIFRTFLINAKP